MIRSMMIISRVSLRPSKKSLMTKKKLSKKIAQHKDVVEKAQPFSIRSGDKSDSLVIIIHGFTSSPFYMHNIADWMAEHGYDIETVLLAGHGGSFDRLKGADASDWQSSLDPLFSKKKNV